jgi:hypothetical protein
VHFAASRYSRGFKGETSDYLVVTLTDAAITSY